MSLEQLVHRCDMDVAGTAYEVLVYIRNDGRHIAKTCFSSEDIIINDADSLADVLKKHRQLLPLAVNSREIRSLLPGNPFN